MRTASFVFASFVFSFVCVAAPDAWRSAGTGEASFSGGGTGGFRVTGTTPEVSVVDDGKQVTVTVGLRALTTGIALRDKHMKEKYLEVDKFPVATLALPLEQLRLPTDGKPVRAALKGKLTLHGIEKETPFHYTITCAADGTCDVDAGFAMSMKDHGITVPRYLGITVKPELTITARFQVKRS